jgi:DNA-binding GntR family transcriptional regulator
MTAKSSVGGSGIGIFRPVPRSAAPLRERTLREIRQLIITGSLEPGVRLTERELIAALGVSRTVIREALRQLECEGLVTMVPNKGPIVRTLTFAEARQLYAIRSVLEGLAVRWFAEQGTQEHVTRLEQALEATVAAYESGNPEVILEFKNRFYDELFEGAGSGVLSSMMATLHGRIWRWRALGLAHPDRSPARRQESIGNLRAMVAAVKARDADLAARIMQDETTRAAAEVMRLLGETAAAAAEGEEAGRACSA